MKIVKQHCSLYSWNKKTVSSQKSDSFFVFLFFWGAAGSSSINISGCGSLGEILWGPYIETLYGDPARCDAETLHHTAALRTWRALAYDAHRKEADVSICVSYLGFTWFEGTYETPNGISTTKMQRTVHCVGEIRCTALLRQRNTTLWTLFLPAILYAAFVRYSVLHIVLLQSTYRMIMVFHIFLGVGLHPGYGVGGSGDGFLSGSCGNGHYCYYD